MLNRICQLTTLAFACTFSLFLGFAQAQNNAQFPASAGGGGGTPCTTTASSLQYNNGGSFGCVAGWTSDGTNITGSGNLTQSGNQSAAAWTTTGLRLVQGAATYTDTSSSGTVAAVYVNRLGIPTLASSSATTYTTAYNAWFEPPTNGANVTITKKFAAGFNGPIGLADGVSAAPSIFALSAPANPTGIYLNGASFSTTIVANGTDQFAVSNGVVSVLAGTLSFQPGPTTGTISSVVPGTAPIIGFGDSSGGSTNGWFNYAGQSRVTSDQTFTSTTTLANITGLSVSVRAGRTYSFDAELSYTDAAAGGIQAAIAGTATATNIIYDGWIVDSGSNGIKGNAQATALAGAVASATTTGTAGHVTIKGTITVNAAGTLTVQAAQNTSNGTATTIKRGSTFIVQDVP